MLHWLKEFFRENPILFKPYMANELKSEKSPYLKQHKDNPVEWLAWNKNSLLKAKEQKNLFF